MKKGGGRLKGNAFEREVAKLIVATFEDHGITNEHCYRTPGSGGHRYAKKKDPGDILLDGKLKKLFPFTIECKSYKRLNWRELFAPLQKGSQFKKWWEQCCMAAALNGGEPLLIFKENRSQAFAMVRQVMVDQYSMNGSWDPNGTKLSYLKTHLRVMPLSSLLKHMAIINNKKFGNNG